MHFQAVFVFVLLPRHGLQPPFLPNGFDDLSVDNKVAERSGVFTTRGGCSAGQAPVMGWAKQKDTLSIHVKQAQRRLGRKRTHSPNQHFCRPRQQRVRNRSIQHVCVLLVLAHGLLSPACLRCNDGASILRWQGHFALFGGDGSYGHGRTGHICEPFVELLREGDAIVGVPRPCMGGIANTWGHGGQACYGLRNGCWP